MKRGWIATIQILLPDRDPKGTECASEAQAADAVSALLTDHAQHGGYILDWAYLKVGGQTLEPAAKYYDPVRYTEGQAFE
jgi:hypothetical protein